MMMDTPVFACFNDGYPLGIPKPHFLLSIVHSVHKTREQFLCCFFIVRQMFLIIRQTEQVVICSEIAMHQGFKVADGSLAIGFSVLGDSRFIFPLPIISKDFLPRGHVITHLGKMRLHSIPSTMTKSFPYSFFGFHHIFHRHSYFIYLIWYKVFFRDLLQLQTSPPPPAGGEK